MHASTLVSILAAASAALVSANPVLGSEGPKVAKLERRIWPLTRRPATPATPAAAPPPPPMCPTMWTALGAFKPTADGHCCVEGRSDGAQMDNKDALHCCMLTATTHLADAPSELPCTNAYFTKPVFFNTLWRCNTGRQAAGICRENRIPVMPEVVNKYAPNGKRVTFGYAAAKRPDPGYSRFRKSPLGDPAPAPVQVAKL
ncbi:hypothetical protein ACKVWC_000054 [Pyricularia oryzae]